MISNNRTALEDEEAAMKILHLGKKGNVEKYLPDKEYLKDVELVDLPITAS